MLLSEARPRPQTPPPQMIWVTWRQHRGLLVGIPVVFVVLVTAMLTQGWKIHRDYARLAACHPVASAACQSLVDGSHNDWHIGNGIRIALLAVPVLLALFAGPPVLARELESGMFRYSWTQGLGRVRWTGAKLVFLGSAVTLPAVLLSLLFTERMWPAVRAAIAWVLDLQVPHESVPIRSLWPMQLGAGACLLAASALLGAGTLRLVRRKAA